MDIRKPFVITVSRELGSGGRTVGRKLAENLGVRYSDKELIQALRERFNLDTASIEKLKSKKKNWFDDYVQLVAPMPKAKLFLEAESAYHATPASDALYKAESEILRAIADEGSCVIAGRLAFFALRDYSNKLDIFITASLPKRVERVMRRQNLTEAEALEAIKKVDSSRENYVKRFSGLSRYDARNYDLVLNMDQLRDEDEAVAIILKYIGVE
jgi:cytidylate kinase